ncbi:MAG: TonB-dependent receptor [Xanthomonadales bacterium]|nr:TonB-dependent receptor [Xanthomonadales bacterium]
MNIQPSRLSIATALALSATLAVAAESPPDEQLDVIVVTGTHVSDRTASESVSPIDIITPELLKSTGTSELATALSRALPSLNFPRPAITDGTDAVRPAQLRGLAPDQVLVLVNGKRRHVGALINLNGSQGRGSAPVDINAIPVSAVERVEVLRDGASALYGSDAIAGVINIVLKGSGTGGSIEAKAGQYSAGDGRQYQLDGDGALGLGENGWLHLAAQAGHQDDTNRARPYIGTPSATSAPPGRVVQRYGDPDYDIGAVSINGAYAFTPGIELYTFGILSNRDVTSNGYFRPAGDSRNIPSIYPDGFLPQILNDSRDRSLLAGLRGDTEGGWHWDVSYNYGYNHLDFDVANSLNRSIGPTSQTDFHAGALEYTQNLVNADFSKAIDTGLAHPLSLAFGAEYREEKFNQSPGEPASYIAGPVAGAPPGAQVFPGFQPGDAGAYDRDNKAVYVSLEQDFTDRFSASLAGRWEDYSDFGSTTSGKFSARYAFTDAVALRGTVSNGFRAPSLAQQYFQSTATNFIGGVPFEVRTFAATNPIAIALGSEPLQAEESTNLGLGLVLQPADGLYVTIDAYRIDVDDRIVLSENLTGAAVVAFLEARSIYGVTGGRYFTNAIDTRTKGLDVVASYRIPLDASTLNLTAGFNYNKTDITHTEPNPPELEQGGLNLQRIGRVETGRIEVGAPKDKLQLGATWDVGSWSFTGGLTRYGEFTVRNASAALDQTFDSQWVLDLAAALTLERWTFTLGADNVTDAYPDEVLYANSTSGQIPYSTASPFGFNGAFVYGKIGYAW